MKINSMGPSGVNPYKRQMNKMDHAARQISKAADKVEISSTAKEMQQVSQFANARQEKIEALRAQIANGTYEINPKETAKGILDFYK